MKLKKLCSAVVACAVLMTGCSGTATEENKGGDTAQNTSGAYGLISRCPNAEGDEIWV